MEISGDRKSDPTISTTFRFNFSYCVSVETRSCQKHSGLFFKVPRGLAVLSVIELLRGGQLTLRQRSLLQSYTVRALDSLNYPVPYIPRSYVPPQLITNSSDSLLNAGNMPVSQLHLRYVQDPSEDR